MKKKEMKFDRGHLLNKNLKVAFFCVDAYEELNSPKGLTGVIINFHCLKAQGRKKLNQG